MEKPDTLGPAEQRYQDGLDTFTRAFRALMARNGLSNQNLEDLANWAYPEQRSWLGSGQISMLRNGQYLRPGPKIFDSLGQLNLALAWLSGCDRGEAAAMATLNLKRPPVRPWEPDEPFWLAHPVTGLPLNAGDLFLTWIGRLQITGIAAKPTEEAAASMSRWLSRHCQQWCADRGKLLSDGLPELLQAYPSRDPGRIATLKAVIAGLNDYSVDELTVELVDLAALVRELNDDAIPADAHPLLTSLQ
jgi:hypothetical protein